MVALSARLRLEIPLPKNSINFSTTPLFLKKIPEVIGFKISGCLQAGITSKT